MAECSSIQWNAVRDSTLWVNGAHSPKCALGGTPVPGGVSDLVGGHVHDRRHGAIATEHGVLAGCEMRARSKDSSSNVPISMALRSIRRRATAGCPNRKFS